MIIYWNINYAQFSFFCSRTQLNFLKCLGGEHNLQGVPQHRGGHGHVRRTPRSQHQGCPAEDCLWGEHPANLLLTTCSYFLACFSCFSSLLSCLLFDRNLLSAVNNLISIVMSFICAITDCVWAEQIAPSGHIRKTRRGGERNANAFFLY